jgi:hypothetical protein
VKSYDTATRTETIRHRTGGPGHAITRRCDNCRAYTTETSGSSWHRKVWWHCAKCTAARKAATEPTA